MVKQLHIFDRFFVDEFYTVFNPNVKPSNPDYIRFFTADSKEELIKTLNLDLSIYKISSTDTRDGTYFEKYLERKEKYEQDRKIERLTKVAEYVDWSE